MTLSLQLVMRGRYFLFFLFLLVNSPNIFAQNKVDSLLHALPDSPDSSKANILIDISRAYLFKNPDSTIHYGLKAIDFAERFNRGSNEKARAFTTTADGHYFSKDYQSSVDYLLKAAEAYREIKQQDEYAEILNKVGINYNRMGNYSAAKQYSEKALQIHQENNNLEGQWKCYSNLGIIAKDLGNLRKSLEYNLESLKISEELNNIEGIRKALTNVGNTYFSLEEPKEALSYYFKAYKLADSLQEKSSMALLNNNIASCYHTLNDREQAIKYYNESLRLKEELQDYPRIAVSLNNIGFIYLEVIAYEKAKNSFLKALEQPHITTITSSNSYNGLARVSMAKNQLKEAEEHALKSHTLAKETGSLEQLKYTTETLYEVYNALKDHENALHYFTLHDTYEDSLINHENLKEIGRLEALYDFSIKEEKMEAEQLQKELSNELALTRQKHLTYIALSGFIAMLIIALIILRSQQHKKKISDRLSRMNNKIGLQKEKIQMQAQKLTELNQVKDRLFMVISHDLRSPLQSLKMMLEMAGKQVITEDEYKKYLPVLAKDVGYTFELLNNLLNWTQSQINGESINVVEFDLSKVIEGINGLYTKAAENKKINLTNEVKEPVVIAADKNMVEMVMRNLISNAIKFCREGDDISITVKKVDDMVEVCVADTGLGIKKENLDNLFNSNNFTTRGTSNEKGTGLGLMLCKEFIEKNGGEIWVRSSPEMGSNFYFTVPLAKGKGTFKNLPDLALSN